ncbi:MAG TPA: serine/threonine-protein kinase [Kofleriaceae bacterium]|nr:serine/threonine-protein kinase [Kofleriaceae bacterium]
MGDDRIPTPRTVVEGGARTAATSPDSHVATTSDATEPTLRPDDSRDVIATSDSQAGIAIPAVEYQLGERIGKGGMGEVIAAHDRRMGRDVAIKRMHGSQSARAVSRFLREARIQARLDHPAIVPVHELGVDSEGCPYFTMKRLAGVTLASRIAGGAPMMPLLRAFVDVCLAIDLAHARGIVHRDLKPANIMLGDYGEVYVIDWGLARVIAEPAETDAAIDAEPTRDSLPTLTRAGAVLGTPGYMPPEQVRGDVVGPAADIYALGAILFEILTGETLHPPGDEALVSTLTGAADSPSQRAPDRGIAPELDATCSAMLALEPERRPTAREVADRVRAYLDGDRDLERRRALAHDYLAAARVALATGDTAAALGEAGRALALAPDSLDAAGLVSQLLLEPPKQLPPPLVASLRELDREALRKRSRRATFSYGMVFAFLALVPVLRIQSWSWLAAFYGVLAALVGFAWHGTRRGDVSPYLSMAGNFALALVWTRVASPFVLTPVMICGALIAVASHPWNQQRPWTIFAWIAVTVMTPFALEAAGVLEPTWNIVPGALQISSTIYAIDGWREAAAVIGANLVFILLVGYFAFTMARIAREAQREVHIQAWHLRHLIPTVRA